MLAIFVLTAGFLGILSLLGQSIHLSKTVSNETTATYLAAEGIEVAKNLIDHDVYAHIPPGTGTGWGTCFGAGGSFEIDYTTTDCAALHQYLGADPPDFLYYNPTSHLYVYSFDDTLGGGSPTIFKRGVKVIPNGSEITVLATVSWNADGAQHRADLEDHFYNWRP